MLILPLEGATDFVFGYSSFEEVLFFGEIDGFAHPWEWVGAVVNRLKTNTL